MIEPAIELVEVGCRLAGRWVLQDLSLRIPGGEVFGLAGANGTGKSLLLAACATLVRPQRGRVTIAGRDARRDAAAVRRVIGYVPEDVGWHPQMAVREDLEFFAGAHGLSRQDARKAAGEALERWGLGSMADLPMGQVSRGFRRRVAVARALLHRPRVLLLDDPASGLDAESRRILWREVRRHAEDGGAALLTSHEPSELAAASHRIGFVSHGRIGEPMEPRAGASLGEGMPDAVHAAGR